VLDEPTSGLDPSWSGSSGGASARRVERGILPAAGGYLLLVLADSFQWPGWVRGLPPFDHLAAVPGEPVNVAGALGMTVVALLSAVLGPARYARRDLRG
jgi:ABC-2 type transport system permease protein